MEMVGRTFSSPLYRYGFNGKEKDDEAKGSGAQYDYGFRIYDPKVGRFLSVDPLEEEYPELTPYQFSSNDPIRNIDLDGLEGKDYTGKFTNATPEQREQHPIWSFFKDLSADMLNLTPIGKGDNVIATWKQSSTSEKIYNTVDFLTSESFLPVRGKPGMSGRLHVEPEFSKTPLKGTVKPVSEKPTEVTPTVGISKQVTQANGKNTGAAKANAQNGYVNNSGVSQKLGKSASSSVLDENLKSSGISRPSNSAAHHIVPGEDPRGAVSRNILQREGIDINEATNGAYLPINSKYARPPETTHSKVHTNMYYSELERRLKGAKPGKVRDELKKINAELHKGTFPY